MRKIFITLIAIFGFFICEAQDKTLEKIDTNYYSYTENTIIDTVHQKGFYKKVNGELKREGNWKLYINGELRTEAIYENDKLKTLIIDGVEYSSKDLKIIRLENKIKDLTYNN